MAGDDVGRGAQGVIDQQRRDQRAVHDQPGIALDVPGIVAVVMDAVRVEGECRIAEQQHGIGREAADRVDGFRSEEHTAELQSLMRISYAVFWLKNTKDTKEQ